MEETNVVPKPVVNTQFKKSMRLDDNIKIYLTEVCCEDGRAMELPQNRVQWRALKLAVFSLRVPLPQITDLVS
jgi:hypothetical protein